MIKISLSHTNHQFEKKNLVTIRDNFGLYDMYECSCGLKGKRFGLSEELDIDGRFKQKALNCPNHPAIEKIKITECHGQGEVFGNLTPGSTHKVIAPPEGYENKPDGVWVNGVGEPVKILTYEYNIIR